VGNRKGLFTSIQKLKRRLEKYQMKYIIPLLLAANMAYAQDDYQPTANEASNAAFDAAMMTGGDAVQAAQGAWAAQKTIEQSEPEPTLYEPSVSIPDYSVDESE
jgi:hypothetical protein